MTTAIHVDNCCFSILDQCLGKAIYVINSGVVVETGELKDVYMAGGGIVLVYKWGGGRAEKCLSVTDAQNLRGRYGSMVLFASRIVEEMPRRWVWEWRKVRYEMSWEGVAGFT
jgi:hypothetical protein